MSASLVELNKLVENEQGVYVHPAAQKDFAYSDGSETEQYLRDILKQSSDLSSHSVELKSHIRDWGSEYHLTPLRANLLRGFDLSSCKRILELGCGCGAITRYLGEQGAVVDSVEGSPVRAELAALRCKDLKNVTISTGNFNDFEFSEGAYDLVLYIGVTEYAGRFSEGLTDEQALQSLLQRAKSSISDDGVVIIAIENRTGLKYAMGANEDHYAEPYIGISSYPKSSGIRTYTYSEWQTQLSVAGLSDNQILFPFPDYKIPNLVISEEFAAKHKYVSNLLEGTNSRDYIEYLDMGGRETMLWRAACEGGYLGQVANSYLILAAKSSQAISKLAAPDFTHLPKFNRRPEYGTLAKKPVGLDEVHREFIDLEAVNQSGSIDGVTHEPDSVEPYFDGPLLSVVWSRTLLSDKHFDEFEQYVRDYFAFLQQEENLNPDLLPSNIILIDGQYKVIDKEWRTEWAVFPELLLYRAIIIFVSSYRNLLIEYSVSRRLVNTLDLVFHCFDLVGKPLGRKMLDDLMEKDMLLQRVAFPEPVLMDMEASFLQRMNSRDPDLAVYWRRNEADYVSADRVVVTAGPSKTRQTVALTLPSDANGLQFIRFDPCSVFWEELAGFFRLSRISLFAINGKNKELVWQCEGENKVADAARAFHGMRFERASFGSGYYLFEEDAWLEFHINPRRQLSKDEHYVFEVDIVFPRSREAIIIGDRYSLASELIEGKLASIADINQRVQINQDNLEQYQLVLYELNEIKRSRVWRYAEAYRDVVHRQAIPKLNRVYQQICRPYKALQKHGVVGLVFHMQKRYADKSEPEVSESEVITTQMGMGPNSYEAWLVSRPAEYWSTQSELNCTPLVSILMPVFDLSPELLDQAITSVLNQVYSEWELCIVDDCSKNRQTVKYLRALHDPRIKVHFSEKNENISLASNHAADLATGEYITLLDHDDMLAPNALLELVLEAQKGADFVYSDEDFLVSDGELEHPHFKPEYSPDLLLSHNYITHMVLIESELFNKVGRFREGYDGAQDYDLYLRLVEQAKKIAHVAKPLYHWRMIESSTSMNPEVKPEAHENARQALKDALVRRGEPAAEVLDGNKMHYFRVRRPIQDDPLVSIVIPLKDKPWLLTKCIQAIQLHSSYQHYEIICVSNDSTSPILFEALENYSKHDLRIRTVELNQGFNFSCVVNAGVRQAKGKHVLLLNNDIEVLSSDWIESLLEHSQRDDVAVVGGKLYYPDRTIQHAGVVLGLGGYAGHIHKNFPAHDDGYANRLQVVQNVTAVTGALLMVKRSIYLELGGFDEEAFAVAFNDVDFCVRAREAGYLNIFTPYCEAYHFESKSRGYEVTPDKASRFSGEMANFRDRHLESIEQGDPYHNPNFDKGHDDYRYLK